MTNSPYVRAALTKVALAQVPPLVRETLLENADFRNEYGFVTDAVIIIGDSGLSFKRSALLNSIRSLYLGATEKKVADTQSKKWRLKQISGEGELPKFALSRGKKRFILPDFWALSPDPGMRLQSFSKAASEVCLPKSAQDRWRNVLAERTLIDDEIDTFLYDFRETPLAKAHAIHSEILHGNSNISSLVPLSRNYYYRLIGEYDGNPSIRDYAAGGGKALIRELLDWQPFEGFLLSLLMSSHSSLTAEIDVGPISNPDIVRAFEFIEKNGDRLSQLGAIEVGLGVLRLKPDIEPLLVRLIKQILDDDAAGQVSGFKLLSALFTFVDGELSRIRLFSNEPPFYRRLASFAQSALIQRQIINAGNNSSGLCDWALNNRGWQFYLQSLIDMRNEPRWNPDFAVAQQIKADFCGRIVIAAKNFEQNIKGSELSDLVLGTRPRILRSFGDFFGPFLPGPLEGAEESQNLLPKEIAETIKQQLNAEEVGPSSFIALVNSALSFRVGADQAELAAKVLKLGNYRLSNLENRSQLLSILNGLAITAAVARNYTLADELRILVRRYRQDGQYALSVREAVRICLVAAASRADLKEWRDFAGGWLTEMAFSDLKGDDGKVLIWQLKYLCHVVPELWISCGRADAALMAYNGSRHFD
jgi:hypothetical protein